ncbi:MAG: hypothetical protein ACQKBU_04905, partial [Verrucomicrobiales bacterium]
MDHRDVLLDGSFEPLGPAQNYPLIIGQTDERLIAAVYQNIFVKIDAEAPNEIHLINGKTSPSLVALFEQPYGEALITTFDTTGKILSKETQILNAGASSWEVPPSSLVKIQRLNSDQ